MSEHMPKDEHIVAAVKEIVRRAIRTLAAVKDPDAKYLGYASLPSSVVQDARDAYGYNSAFAKLNEPTPQEVSQMEVVAVWLAWLRREKAPVGGHDALRRLIAWSGGGAVWKIAHREGCSERTIHNRIDRSIAAICRQFIAPDVTVEIVEEPYKSTPFAFTTKPYGPHGEVRLAKVYIADFGWVKGSRKWDDGKRRFEELAAA